MNTINPDENTRPFGFWLKAVDRLMAAEFATAFESEGITRRDWRMLNIVDGSATGDARPLSTHKLHRLIERGWVTVTDGAPALTDSGRDAMQRLGDIVDGIRAKVTDAVPADDLATTMKTLEQLAVAFGWDEETPLPRGGRHRFGKGTGHRRGFGHGHGRGFGPGFGHGRGFGPGHGDEHCQHGHRHGDHEQGDHSHGDRRRGGPMRARFAHFAQDAYERGFDAGFTRAHDTN
jgi:hypothetical protein